MLKKIKRLSIFISFGLLCHSSKTYSKWAIVNVYMAPLFNQNSLEAEVIEWLPKGSKLFIHDQSIDIKKDHSFLNRQDIDYIKNTDLLENSLQLPTQKNNVWDNFEDLESDLVDLDEEILNDLDNSKMNLINQEDKKIIDEIENDLINSTSSSITGPEFSDFYLTLDKNGNKAYILKEYVVIHSPLEQSELNIKEESKKLEYDPTDYRPKSKISDSHPFIHQQSLHSEITFGLSNNPKSPYNYTEGLNLESYQIVKSLSFGVLKNLESENLSRLSIGPKIKYSYFKNTFGLKSSLADKANENHHRFSLGPYFTYDCLQYKNMIFSISGSILVNYYFISVTQELSGDEVENRRFTSFSVSPSIGTKMRVPNLWDDIGLVSEIQISPHYAKEVNPSSDIQTSTLWASGANDIIKYDFHTELIFSLGFMSNF